MLFAGMTVSAIMPSFALPEIMPSFLNEEVEPAEAVEMEADDIPRGAEWIEPFPGEGG